MNASHSFLRRLLSIVACALLALLGSTDSALAQGSASKGGGQKAGGSDCVINGPSAVCSGDTDTFISVVTGSAYAWSFVGSNTAGASFCSASNLKSVCVTTLQPGAFTVQLTVTVQSGPKTCSLAVTADSCSGPDCQIGGPDPVCAGDTDTYSSLIAGSAYAWSLVGPNTAGAGFCGPTDQQSVCVSTTQAGVFRLQLTVTVQSGPKTCSMQVTVDSCTGNDCLIAGPDPVCAGDPNTYLTPINGSAYAWSLVLPNTAGAAFCGPTDQQSVCVSTTQPGVFRLQLVVTVQSGPKTCAMQVTVDDCDGPDCQITGPEPVCAGVGNTYQTPINGSAFAWALVPPNTAAAFFCGPSNQQSVCVIASQPGVFRLELTVTVQSGPKTCANQVAVSSCVDGLHCTLTQAELSDLDGWPRGMPTYDLLTALLWSDLVLGLPGRSLTIPAGVDGAACIVARGPAVGISDVLPAFGDEAIDPQSLQTISIPLPLSEGRFENRLLGEAIALALNVRNDPELADLGVCATMTTQGLSAGLDGWLGTHDDVLDPGPDGVPDTSDDAWVVTIPVSVLVALDVLQAPHTVGGLLVLSDLALAGADVSPATSADIASALAALNTAFSGCRLLTGCSD